MEKIKNLLNPGSKKDDEILYGSGSSSDPVNSGATGVEGGKLRGESGHFARFDEDNHIKPATGTRTTDYASATPLGSNNHGSGNLTSSSHMLGMSDDDTASIKSGVTGFPQSSSALTGPPGNTDPLDTNKPLPREPQSEMLGSTTAGPHSSNLANRADPRVDTNPDGSRGLGSNPTGVGSGLTGSNLPHRGVGGTDYGNTTSGIGSSGHGRDAALGAGAIGAGEAAHHHHHHHGHHQSDIGSNSGRSFPLGGNSNNTSSSGYPIGSTGSTTAGPHSSNLANRADPRVDSNLDGSRTAGNTGYGTDVGSTIGSSHPSHLGRDAALGAGAVGAASFVGREYGNTGNSGSTTTGPHSSNLANRADPRVDSDMDGSRGLGSTGQSANSSTPIQVTPLPNIQGYGEESWRHDHPRHGHQYEGDPCANEPPVPGPHLVPGPHATDTANLLDPRVSGVTVGGSEPTTGTGHHGLGSSTAGATTAGPHSSNLANRADPRVDSDVDGSRGLGSGKTGTGHHGLGSTTGSSHPSHLGRDIVLGAGAVGVAGLAGREHDYTGTSGSTTAGPRSSSLENKADPRADRDLDGSRGAGSAGYESSNMGRSTGSSGGAIVGSGYDDTALSQRGDRHLGRDAALAGGAGAAGVGALEASRGHHGSSTGPASDTTGPHKFNILNTLDPRVKEEGIKHTTEPLGDAGSSTTTGPTTTGRDHYYGRDAGLVGAGGAAAYEADKHHKHHGASEPTTQTSGNDHHYGRDAGLVGAGGTAAYEADKHHKEKHGLFGHHSSGTEGTSSHPSAMGDSRDHTGSHRGRDAALAGGAGAAAYEADKHHHGQHGSTGTSSYPSSSLDGRSATSGTHQGRDAALAGGVGAATGAEFSKKDAEKAAKEHHKELEKEQKHLHKEEKKHEKAVEKEEAHHGHSDGKKHGLFGFLHRDKSDKELKEEEAARTGHSTHHGAEAAAGVGAAGAGAAIAGHEHGDRNRLHKDPPPGYGQAGYEEPPTSGYAAQVTGGTGTTALAKGDPLQRGSHLTGAGNVMDPAVDERGNLDSVPSSRTGISYGDMVGNDPHYGGSAADPAADVGGIGSMQAPGYTDANRRHGATGGL